MLAREAGNGAAAAQAQSLCTRAGVLSVSNDEAFAAATEQLAALEQGEGDGFWLAVALGHAADTPGVICEAACDLALLAAELAETGDVARRADYVGIAQLAAAAATTASLLVRTNLVISEDDWRLAAANAAAEEARRSRSARRRRGVVTPVQSSVRRRMSSRWSAMVGSMPSAASDLLEIAQETGAVVRVLLGARDDAVDLCPGGGQLLGRLDPRRGRRREQGEQGGDPLFGEGVVGHLDY